MRPLVVGQKVQAMPTRIGVVRTEARWDLAFIAILGYLVEEYSRLSLMYPILRPLHLAKVLAALCVIGLLSSPRVPVERRSSPMNDKPLWAFLLAILASALLGYSLRIGWAAFLEALTWAVTYFLLSRILITTYRLRIFVFTLLVLNFKLAQFVVRYYFQLQSWGRDQRWLAGQGVGAGSTDFFGNSADLGLAMVVAWAIAGSLLLGEKKKFARLILLFCLVGFFAAILLCGSRGAIVGAAAVVLAAWARKPQKIGAVVALIVFAVATYTFLPEGMKAKMRSAQDWRNDPTAYHRTLLWKAGLQMFKDHPLFGVGLGNFPIVYFEEYPDFVTQDPTARWYTRGTWVPHSIYVQSLSETGLAGTVPLLLLCLFCFRTNARTRRHLETLKLADRQNFEYRLSIGLDLALVGYLVSGAFIAVIYYPHLWFLVGLSAGLQTACLRIQPEAAAVPETETRKRTLVLATS